VSGSLKAVSFTKQSSLPSEPSGEVMPHGQLVHAAEPGGENLPGEHARHSSAPTAENLPGAQVCNTKKSHDVAWD
jgi:hypothetical protein